VVGVVVVVVVVVGRWSGKGSGKDRASEGLSCVGSIASVVEWSERGNHSSGVLYSYSNRPRVPPTCHTNPKRMSAGSARRLGSPPLALERQRLGQQRRQRRRRPRGDNGGDEDYGCSNHGRDDETTNGSDEDDGCSDPQRLGVDESTTRRQPTATWTAHDRRRRRQLSDKLNKATRTKPTANGGAMATKRHDESDRDHDSDVTRRPRATSMASSSRVLLVHNIL
jgi:hypothetical protein